MSRCGFTLLLVTAAFLELPHAGAQGFGVVAGADGSGAGGSDAATEEVVTLVTRFYDITPLVVSRQQYPFDEGAVGAIDQALPLGGFGGGGGEAGMMGGGGAAAGGGGGGFFSVPAEPAQFGGGGSPGGMDSGYGEMQSEADISLKSHLENSTGEGVISLFERNVAPDSWMNTGGAGTITELGSTMLVRQTEAVHAELAAFLKQLTTAVVGKDTYHLEVWWLPTADADRENLQKNLLGANANQVSIPDELSSLCSTANGYHGTLLCRERVTTHMASGQQVPVVVGSIPVVGTGTTGDQPIVKSLHLGLMFEAKLSPVPVYLTDMDIPGTERLELQFRSATTNRGGQGQEWQEVGKIDRYVMGRHVAEGSCQIQLGKATQIASLTELSSTVAPESGRMPELLMIVRVTKSED